MTTADMALKLDPIYAPISKRFHENPAELRRCLRQGLVQAHTPRHGPDHALSRHIGASRAAVVAGPGSSRRPSFDDADDTAALKAKILASGLSILQLVTTAWASASTFRGTDKRGGANGARIRLSPQKDWEVNNPAELGKVLQTLEGVQKEFSAGGKKVSLADIIVLGGCAAVEQAAKNAGHDVQVPFSPGRTDAAQEQTDVDSFAVLEPNADGFRNYLAAGQSAPAPELLLERARLLTLTAPEMTVLVGGLRVLNGDFTKASDTLSNDFFVNLLDMGTEWKASSKDAFEGCDRATGAVKWTGTAVDLVFGSNSQLRGLAEVYASEDAGTTFVNDFAAAWSKVMHLDRFDLA